MKDRVRHTDGCLRAGHGLKGRPRHTDAESTKVRARHGTEPEGRAGRASDLRAGQGAGQVPEGSVC